MTKLISTMQIVPSIALVLLFAAPIGAYADQPGARVFRGYRLTGTHYSQIKTSQHDCKRTCDISSECRAWNYVAAGEYPGNCYLLSNPGYRDGWVSGIKPPPPAVKAGRDQPPLPPVVKR
jgi:hypothetical protein